MLTAKDIPQFTGRDNWTDAVALSGGYSVRVKVDPDEYNGNPWDECDGHGPVSKWRPRDSKRPGERVLHNDGRECLFYDFAAAVALAKKDGWDAPPYKTGTAGERAVRAVERNFEFLRRFCSGEWYYVTIGVEVSRHGAVLDTDYCGGIESDGAYWREHAAETARGIIAADQKARRIAAATKRRETIERQYWAARDVVTV